MNHIEYLKKNGIKHSLEVIYDYKLGIAFEKIMLFLTKYIDLKDIIIIESHNAFDSNGGAFYDYLIKNRYNKKYKIVWFLRNASPKKLPYNVKCVRYNRPSIRRAYYHCVAKYIICGHWLIPSIRENQISYYTTHGAFGLKSVKGKINIPDNINYILTPSEFLKPILADDFSIEYPNKRQIVLGFPYVDIFYNSKEGDLKKLTSKEYKKKILWMPTFRNNVDGRIDFDGSSGLGIPIFSCYDEYKELNGFLNKNNALLIIKIHPMQNLSSIKIKSLSNIIVLDGITVKRLEVDNYRLMKDTDVLISDYSSAAYDYLHLNKPIAYTMDDAKDYKLGLKVDDPENYMAGDIVLNVQDFYRFLNNVIIGNDEFKNKREQLFNKIWDFHDGENCKRLAEHMGLKL